MKKRGNLVAFRKSLGLTIDQMAEKLKCTSTHYNNIELGKSDGSIEFWEKFQDVFGVDDMWELIRKGD